MSPAAYLSVLSCSWALTFELLVPLTAGSRTGTTYVTSSPFVQSPPIHNFPQGAADVGTSDRKLVLPGQAAIGEQGIQEWMRKLQGSKGPVDIEVGYDQVGSVYYVTDGHHRFCAAMRLGQKINFIASRISGGDVAYIKGLEPFKKGVHWNVVSVPLQLKGSVFNSEHGGPPPTRPVGPPPMSMHSGFQRQSRNGVRARYVAPRQTQMTQGTFPGHGRHTVRAPAALVGDKVDLLDLAERGELTAERRQALRTMGHKV